MARHCPAMDDCHCVLIAMVAINIHVTEWALPDGHILTQDTELGTHICNCVHFRLQKRQ